MPVEGLSIAEPLEETPMVEARRTIEMVAHCIFHQTPPRERARCDDCRGEIKALRDTWYCPVCLRRRRPTSCPICEARPWL